MGRPQKEEPPVHGIKPREVLEVEGRAQLTVGWAAVPSTLVCNLGVQGRRLAQADVPNHLLCNTSSVLEVF